ncbi:MAG: hypothetical protein M0C28_17425 [Candidatus Moduliflexus flocculans]|nr:hypothetical protein [Candidatus Moduliflexus flocculans]
MDTLPVDPAEAGGTRRRVRRFGPGPSACSAAILLTVSRAAISATSATAEVAKAL